MRLSATVHSLKNLFVKSQSILSEFLSTVVQPRSNLMQVKSLVISNQFRFEVF